MPPVRSIVLLGVLAAAACQPTAFTPMSPQQFQALPVTHGDTRITYGPDPENFGDLRLPSGRGPFPVAVLIHGGCFRAEFARSDELSQMAEALRKDGVATWNIEYRRLGQPGGGWPGTYLDVGAGIDKLRDLAKSHPLDLSRVVVVGHSAGGHLAHWSAARGKLLAGSPLAAENPVVPRGIVNLAGLPDLREHVAEYEAECMAPVIQQMLGGTPAAVPVNASAAAPTDRLPLGVRQTIVLGDHENFVPRPIAEAYLAKARAAGDEGALVLIPAAGHFEIAAATSRAWPRVGRAILDSLKEK